jgi:acetyltransferase-like isoleucine patch superfamily enzyme
LLPRAATKLQYLFYRRYGVCFDGYPNFLAGDIWIDGSDYRLIFFGNGVTISAGVRMLTHDWALHTVSKSLSTHPVESIGKLAPIRIGDFSFIGMGVLILPGATIGCGCLIGAGAVVRGNVPDYSVVIGNPGAVVGDTREYVKRLLNG